MLGILALILWPATASHAQAIYGSISGTVTDSTGAVVPNATVTVTDVGKGTIKVEKTNATGAYYIHELIPDVYLLKVEAQGFNTAKSSQLTVTADSTVVFDVKLTVGGTAQTVQVTTEAPQLTVDRAEVSTQLNEETVENIPNLERNVTALPLLAPGTSTGLFDNANAEDPMRSLMVAANGQSPEAAGFVLDGANDKDSWIGEIVVNPPLDSIQETKFVNQDYDAEFGAAIAGITVMQTKSGSNSFHGSAYDFRHSDAQEARDPFTQYPGSNPTGPVVPPTLENKYGGSIGGPIIKGKLFFFGDYQGTRSKIGSSFFETVPTKQVQTTCTATGSGNCNLSEYLAASANSQVYDPAQGALDANGGNTGVGRTAFAGNLIPNSRLSLAAVNFMNFIPLPNVSTATIANNYLASGFGIFNFDQYDTRWDWQLKDKMHIFGRYGYLGSSQNGPASLGKAGGNGFGNGGWAGVETGGNDSLAVGADYVLSPRLLTDFRFSYLRYALVEAKFDGTTPIMTQAGWAGLNTSAAGSGGASEINFQDNAGGNAFAIIGSGNNGAGHCACPLDMTQTEYEVVNNWTLDAGRHSVHWGADLRWAHQLRVPGDQNRAGMFTFGQNRTGLGTPNGLGGYNVSGGLGLATYLFGDPTAMDRFVSSNTTAAETQPRTFFYVQDDWRVSQKLTVNAGVRWEIIWPEYVNGAGQGGFWNSETDMIQVAGVGQVNMHLNIKNNFAHVEPRIGLAYQATPKSVFRAGVAFATDTGYWGDSFGGVVTQTLPVLQTQSFSQQDSLSTDAARLASGAVYNIANAPDTPTSYPIPASGLFLLPEGQSPATRSNKVTTPEVYGWNVAYQWQFNPTMSLSAAYVGNKGTHTIPGSAWGGSNFDQAPLSGIELGATCQANPFYMKFGYLYPGTYCGPGYNTDYDLNANSHYNSVQVVLDKRVSNGLQFQASYVYSETAGVENDNYFVQDPHSEWGAFDYNRPSYFKVYGDYDLPFGRGKQFGSTINPIADAIVGGFAVDATLGWANGLPYTMGYNECGTDAPNGVCRVSQVGSFTSSSHSSLNTAGHYVTAFTPVAALTTNGATSGPWERPQPYTYGNTSQNQFLGPGYFNTDATLRKAIPIHEEAKLTMEVQVRNLFNHVILSNPDGCADCSIGSGAGQITDILGGSSAGAFVGTGMRQVEFGAHVTF